MTLAELEQRTLERLGETSAAGTYYSSTFVKAALNEGQRLFAFLTLCLETTGSLPLTANTAWYEPLATFNDWIVPLRVRLSGTGGTKLEPYRLERLDALSPNWQSESGPPRRYASCGPNLVAIHPSPTTGGATLDVTYARSPVPLVGSGQTPEIPTAYHPSLIKYALPRLRASEGAEEWRKNLPDLLEFWRDAKKLAMYVRTRNLTARYDCLPPEERFFDGSRLMDIMTRRPKWPTMLDIPQAQAQRSPQTT
jgi:hypothetical protein